MSAASGHKFECNLHVALIHFDQIIGPHLLQIYPDIETQREKRVSKVLQQLIDVGSLQDTREWEFVYSDRYFSSLNVYLTILNSNARGGQSDFMISLMITPTYSQIVAGMVMDWNSLYELKLNCMELLTPVVQANERATSVLEELRFIFATNIDMIRANLQAKLEIISPNQFTFI
ncbi:MAG: hypothetical protein ACW99A_24190 [Candidatus Kariarchaeaceae archaeon]|jgi:hypothetical protein